MTACPICWLPCRLPAFSSNGFRYTIAVENASSAKKDGGALVPLPSGSLEVTDIDDVLFVVWLPNAERTSSFFEVSCFGKMADSMLTKFEKIPNGCEISVARVQPVARLTRPILSFGQFARCRHCQHRVEEGYDPRYCLNEDWRAHPDREGGLLPRCVHSVVL